MNTFSSKLILVALLWVVPARAVEKWQLALGATAAALLTGSMVLAKTKNQLLMKAVKNNWTVTAKTLVQAGADVNYQAIYDKYGTINYGATPLLWATENNNVELVQFLLEHQADVNERNFNQSYTPLHRAAIKGHYEVAKKLIEHGADIN